VEQISVHLERIVANIRDVARLADVSIATVSRVFNDSTRVSEQTRRHVRTIASRVGYWPNTAARSLTTSRTSTLGVLLPDLYGEFYSEVIRGIDQAARRDGYQILISGSHADTVTLITAARAMHGLVEGLIIMAPDNRSAAALQEIMESIPAVLLNPPCNDGKCQAISIANYDGAYAITGHLLSLGHRQIAMVKGPSGNMDSEERLKGYRAAMLQAGISPSPDLEFQGDFTEMSGCQAGRSAIQRNPRPTAVVAANDYMAIGLMSALREAGVRMPEEMAVTGFDDIEIAQYMNPPLTTVHVDTYELGERAFQRWIQAARSGGAASPAHEILPTRLVVRQSCGSNGKK
jgi:LacI family transcriptional regulator